ncbi:hypothetical protein GCM10025858_02190 [Alicyclobacillus sacchari]|nr:hypothetical protein GCM10025858_02190 [Alicyclobacillus sacchari]
MQPDVAIAIDVTFGAFPGQAADESFALDAGPAISFGPNLHRKVFQRLVDVAERHRIPYQIELSQTPVGADANAFQVATRALPRLWSAFRFATCTRRSRQAHMPTSNSVHVFWHTILPNWTWRKWRTCHAIKNAVGGVRPDWI